MITIVQEVQKDCVQRNKVKNKLISHSYICITWGIVLKLVGISNRDQIV